MIGFLRHSPCGRGRGIGLAATLALAGCATQPSSPPQSACPPPGHAAIQAELLFGLAIAGNHAILPAAFDAFVASDISPRFPAGLTVLPASGAWRAPDGQHTTEPSRMVLIAAADTPETAERLRQIRAAYRARFAQQSVGLITIQSCASF